MSMGPDQDQGRKNAALTAQETNETKQVALEDQNPNNLNLAALPEHVEKRLARKHLKFQKAVAANDPKKTDNNVA